MWTSRSTSGQSCFVTLWLAIGCVVWTTTVGGCVHAWISLAHLPSIRAFKSPAAALSIVAPPSLLWTTTTTTSRSNSVSQRRGSSVASAASASSDVRDSSATNQTSDSNDDNTKKDDNDDETSKKSTKLRKKTSGMIPKHKFLPLAEQAKAYLTASTDPYHAVSNAVQLLKRQGFTKWSPHHHEKNPLQAGGKYYYTVQQSTLVAFTVGGQASIRSKHDNDTNDDKNIVPFCIVGGHTDSPNFRLKPRSKCTAPSAKHGCIQLGVECYGGGLWHTWLDRDLSVSGNVLVRTSTDHHKITNRLVQLSDPIARISSLCIHLQTADERKALALNRETHTVPIVASTPQAVVEPYPLSLSSSSNPSTATALEQALEEQINTPVEQEEQEETKTESKEDDKTEDKEEKDPWRKGQEPLLLQRIAQELKIDVDQIADWDLSLYDAQPAALGGLHSEFLYSGRLDNLATVFCSITALCDHAQWHNDEARHISLVCAFDHEEVGSTSTHGAGSPVLEQALQQISRALGQDHPLEEYPSVVAQSFCMSVDQAHAIHPNYAGKHETSHGPTLNTGLVIKSNSNQRYATNTVTGFLVVCRTLLV